MLDVKVTGHSSTKELDNMYMLVLHQPITDCCDEERNGREGRSTGGDVMGPPPVVYPSTGSGVPGAAPSTGFSPPPPGAGAPQ